MALVEWNESLSVGARSIDGQQVATLARRSWMSSLVVR